MTEENARGRVIICPTPIGNLGDMTQRAINALREADTVCAEDTRVTGNLLAALGISKRLERLDENVIAMRAEQIAQRALAGVWHRTQCGLRLRDGGTQQHLRSQRSGAQQHVAAPRFSAQQHASLDQIYLTQIRFI